MGTVLFLIFVIGGGYYLYQKRQERVAEIEVKYREQSFSREATEKYEISIIPTIFTPLRILELRHLNFNNRVEAERLNLNPKFAHIVHSGYYSPDSVWTDVGKMYSSKDLEQYFEFLEEIRTIVEDDSLTTDIKVSDIIFTCKQKQLYKKYFIKLNKKYGSFPACIFYKELTKVNGIGDGTAEALYNEGILSMDELKSASESELLEVPGVGKKTVKQIRNYFDNRIEL